MKPENNPNILLVDDDENTRLLIKEVLIATNISIFESSTSKQALSIFKNNNGQFHLVLLDILLPDYDGVTLLKQMLQINPEISAIAISAIDPGKLSREYNTNNFVTLISKPFKIHEFINTIAPYVGVQLQAMYWEKRNNGNQAHFAMFVK
jgi:DNA-binding NtrC family response regulator